MTSFFTTKITKLSLSLTLLIFFSTHTSCTTSQECKSALSDLTTEVVVGGLSTVITGVPFNVPSIISNVKDALNECNGEIMETLTANASKSNIRLSKKNNDGSFSEVISNNFDVPEIPEAMQAEENYELLITEPGEYQIITLADATSVVDERDENNNASPTVSLGSGKTGAKIASFTVLPNPNFKKAAQAPVVEILSRTVIIK